MQSKIIIGLGVIIIACILSIIVLSERIKTVTDERDRHKQNTNAVMSDIKRMQINSTTMALDAKILRLTLDEYKTYRADDLEEIKKLNVQVKSLKAVAKHNIEVNADIKAELKDTVVIRDTVTVALKSIKMETPYLKVKGIIENNQLIGNVTLPVTLHQAVWVEHKHRFLWWKWGVKAIHQTISSDNPHVQIKYTEIIEIQK